MKRVKRGWALIAGTALAVCCAWACTATRNGDGSITIEFAPDMVIRAWGLEDALAKVDDLQRSCLDGTFDRPCTEAERDDIQATRDRILESKDKVGWFTPAGLDG